VTSAPRVSVGVPVYNGERHLRHALDDLVAQDLMDIEILVSDNASTDRTRDIVAEVAARDPRVRLLRNPENLGAARNYNLLVGEARAPLFKWASADDRLSPTYLSACVARLDAEPHAALAYAKTTLIDEDGSVIREHEDGLHLPDAQPWRRLRAFAQNRWLCNPCFGVIRTERLRRTSLVGPRVSSDITLLAQLALLGPFIEVPERLFFRRVAADSCGLGDLTKHEVAQWFDAGARTPVVPPLIRVFMDIELSIVRADLPPAERARAAAAFAHAWSKRRVAARVHRVGRTWRGVPQPTIRDVPQAAPR
jgi:glycosyltransferase involved in cell wall biosynthesis